MRFLKILSSLIFVLITGCATSLPPLPPPLTSHQRVEQLGQDSVALVHTYNGVTRPMCSGTWIGPDLILTAHHCVEGIAQRLGTEQLIAHGIENGLPEPQARLMAMLAGEAVPFVEPASIQAHFIVQDEVTNVNEEPLGDHVTKVLSLSKEFDIAVLQVIGDDKLVKNHSYAHLAAKTPEVGEAIYVMGTPNGVYWTYMQGMVEAYRQSMHGVGVKKTGPFLQIQAPVYMGNSGGGVFNSQGELVGMADFISPAPEMAFCVHLETIRGYLAGQHLITLVVDAPTKK